MLDGADELNSEIKDWAGKTIAHQQTMFETLGIQHRANSPSPRSSKDSLSNSFGSSQGIISRVGFKFPQPPMVYVAKGVGKGVPISRAGSSGTTRKAKDWFNSVIDRDIEDLADIVANGQADLVVKNLRIR